VGDVTFDATGKLVITGGTDGMLRFWAADTGVLLDVQPIGQPGSWFMPAWSQASLGVLTTAHSASFWSAPARLRRSLRLRPFCGVACRMCWTVSSWSYARRLATVDEQRAVNCTTGRAVGVGISGSPICQSANAHWSATFPSCCSRVVPRPCPAS